MQVSELGSIQIITQSLLQGRKQLKIHTNIHEVHGNFIGTMELIHPASQIEDSESWQKDSSVGSPHQILIRKDSGSVGGVGEGEKGGNALP